MPSFAMRYLLFLVALLALPSIAIQPQRVFWASLESQDAFTQASTSIGVVPVVAKIQLQGCDVQGVTFVVAGETVALPSLALSSGGCPRPSKMTLLYSSCCYTAVPSVKPEDETLYLDLIVPLEEQAPSPHPGQTIEFRFTYKPGALRVLWPLVQP
ncbi:hypothetical protein [Paucibacter sp. KBW04]|uniref:hypothetical protein n=1 Tax=Paucibacter sp. KBW04 TaxID=2153361 RepID=UPI0018CC6821|nr:hypothetical protein [Paucibacter sp. KBW04]